MFESWEILCAHFKTVQEIITGPQLWNIGNDWDQRYGGNGKEKFLCEGNAQGSRSRREEEQVGLSAESLGNTRTLK